jgi:hypothetical protein
MTKIDPYRLACGDLLRLMRMILADRSRRTANTELGTGEQALVAAIANALHDSSGHDAPNLSAGCNIVKE